MKKSPIILAAGFFVMSLAIVSCGGENTASDVPAVDSTLLERAVVLNLDSSNVTWKGEMLGVFAHEGNVQIKEGTLSVAGDSITAGSFVIDLNTITPTDTNFNEAEGKTTEVLIGHLRSDDFFAVDSISTATFTVTSFNGNVAMGKLNVRGVEGDENITDVVVSTANGMTTVTGKLVFDRQKYGVAWASPMKDMVLSDNIEINVSLIGQ